MSRVAAGYEDFAEHEAAGRSPLYVELAHGVAHDAELLRWLDGLPTGKRQPNLLFTAYRLVAGTPAAGRRSAPCSASAARRSRR